MKLNYTFNDSLISLKEMQNGNDVEFTITLLEKNLKPQLEKVEDFFNQNNIVTDVLFYVHKNQHYQIIVRKDFYEDFVLQLFKQQLLHEVKWI